MISTITAFVGVFPLNHFNSNLIETLPSTAWQNCQASKFTVGNITAI